MRRVALIVALVIALPLVVGAGAFVLGRRTVVLSAHPRLGEAGRRAAIALVRTVFAGGAAPAPEGELAAALPQPGTVRVELWHAGTLIAATEGHGARVGDALADAATRLAARPDVAVDPETRDAARVVCQIVIGRGPLPSWPAILRRLGVVPGLDGLAVEVAGREVILYPDELVRARLFSGPPLAKGIEVSLGVDLEQADGLLAQRAKLGPGRYGAVPRSYRRVRVDTFVESKTAGVAPLALVRGHAPAPEVTARALIDGAVAGAHFLAARVGPRGRYEYEVDLATGKAPEGSGYSMPRHAGTTYFLAQVYAVRSDPVIAAAADRALEYLERMVTRGKCRGERDGKRWACVADGPTANAGSTALALLALTEFAFAADDHRRDGLIAELAEWLLWLERPEGGFVHLFDVAKSQKDEQTRLLYFDGEAALGLIRAYRLLGDPRYLAAARRALDATLRSYDFFAGRFFFGEEHWTCLAAEAGYPEITRESDLEFCSDYATFLRAQQFGPGEIPGQEDLAGAYGATPFLVPNNTPTGSRTETMIAAYDLSGHFGRPDARIRAQNLAALGYLLGQQVGPDAGYASPLVAPAGALGAVTGSAVDGVVRIDYVQHVCSAMLRGARLASGAEALAAELYPPNAAAPRKGTPWIPAGPGAPPVLDLRP